MQYSGSPPMWHLHGCLVNARTPSLSSAAPSFPSTRHACDFVEHRLLQNLYSTSQAGSSSSLLAVSRRPNIPVLLRSSKNRHLHFVFFSQSLDVPLSCQSPPSFKPVLQAFVRFSAFFVPSSCIPLHVLPDFWRAFAQIQILSLTNI